MNADTPENILFEYLRNILYFPDKAQLNPQEMPEQMRRLADGLALLGSYIKENTHFITALANGDLSCPLPNVENTVAASAKALHASLSHLTWQTKRVAQGDFTQHVDFMGEFSDAFNYMIDQLRQAKVAEKLQLEAAEQRVLELSQAKELFLDMAASNRQLVVVTSANHDTILFSNRDMSAHEKDKLRTHLKIRPGGIESHVVHWEYSSTVEKGNKRLYSVSSHAMTWDGKNAIANVISDITEQKKKEQLMQLLAYSDALTGLYNRRYGMEYLTKLKSTKKHFSVAFCDLDNLKYCNDNFGHEEGNRYIISCCQVLEDMAINKVICRAGGDEFLVICEDVGRMQLEAELVRAQNTIQRRPTPCGYRLRRNISFGVAENSENQELSATLAVADERMYAQKKEHKLFALGEAKAMNDVQSSAVR